MRSFFFLFILLLGSFSPMFAQQAPANALDHIQTKLASNPTLDSLLALTASLDRARAAKPNAYYSYWEAYVQYRLTFAYAADRKGAEKAVNKGIELLEAIKSKNSEHYALLSLLQGAQLEFASAVAVPFKATAVTANARKAIELDPNNLRGYLALAVCDAYTPKLYGGGKLVEENLKKAISLPPKTDVNTYAPDWGQGTAYWHLAKFYKDAGKLDLAKQYATEGAAKYPLNRGLHTLATTL